MKYIDQLELKGKRVFLRADLNVPLKEGRITDDYRIRATLPTIKFAVEKGARLILCSHLGRPEGRDLSQSLRPVAARISELLSCSVTFVEDCVGVEAQTVANNLKEGEIALLENVRFYEEEEKNDPEFAKKLASLCDVYVNDAFATAHRKHASTAGICKFVSEKAGGFTMKDELTYFDKALKDPKRPLVAIFGGSKVSTKMNAIKFAGIKANKVIIGGAMANTFFRAHGKEIGRSLYEPEVLAGALEAEAALKEAGVELYLPVDVVVASALKSGVETRVVPIDEIPSEAMALDIGPKTNELFDSVIKSAGTIVWNGPMGAFETEEFSGGTYRLIDSVIASPALSLVGGGDTDLALHQRHAFDKVSYVSTAGGAFLKLLEGGTLAAVKALES
jgi:phosphoglycerate kinase